MLKISFGVPIMRSSAKSKEAANKKWSHRFKVEMIRKGIIDLGFLSHNFYL